MDLNEFGIHDEPTVQDSIRAGIDVVSFSGDKLLGGPQAGIILGKRKCLDILKKHPLNRAVRVDKMTLAALEATLHSYEAEKAEEIPVIAMLGAAPESLKAKAETLHRLLTEAGISCEVISSYGQVGGGSAPTKELPSFAVALHGNANALEEKLRRNDIPIIGRIHEGRFLLDVRTLFAADFPKIREALA